MDNKKTIVIKIGTSSLTCSDGTFSEEKLNNIVMQAADIIDAGNNVIIVSSGSIAAGFQAIGYNQRPVRISEKQAAASVGQCLLIEKYNEYLAQRGYTGAQILLTRGDFLDKRRYDNAFATLTELIHVGAVPVINENDTTSIEELRFGDNDTLSAQVAAMVHADLLIIATDVDGLYTSDPRTDSSAEHIDVVEKITPEIWSIAGDAGSSNATGGMHTKILAAEIATISGVPVFICSYRDENSIVGSANGTARGTYFKNSEHHLKTKLQWIAFCSTGAGRIYIDPGATDALLYKGKSLLPSGVISCEGKFMKGDVVDVYSFEKKFLGRGVAEYDSDTLEKCKNNPTSSRQKVAVHRNNWVSADKVVLLQE